jgi:signal transduction histidine kinase
VSIWGFGAYIISISNDATSALFWWRIAHIGIIIIPSSFLIFAYHFFNKQSSVKTTVLISITIVFLFLNGTNHFINSVKKLFGSIYYDTPPTPLYILFIIFFVICMSKVFSIGIKAYLSTSDTSKKRQFLYFSLATLVGSVGGSTSFLPVFGIELYPYLNASIIFFPFIIGYAILRYNLFDLKAVITELIMFSIWILLLLKSIFSTTIEDSIISWALLGIVIVLGTLLIKSVRKEIETRQRIQNLAKDLSLANEHLKELDQQKSEFVSLASHQLRGPLTAIKGYASMLLDGDFGEMKAEIRDAVDKIFQSTQSLVVLVNDYLDVSRIEQGRMQYDFSTFDMRDLAVTVVTELRPNIERAKLSIDFDYDMSGTYILNADQGKIKQVISNLVDNAIKYTPKGGIHLWLTHTSNEKILLTISDTGVGIRPDVLPRLFEKFTRAPDASKTNIMGTGLGLYVAKKMIEAHHGRIWAESAGQGKGASFFIELEASR